MSTTLVAATDDAAEPIERSVEPLFHRDRNAPALSHYVIFDEDTMVVSTDYHVAKNMGRTLAWLGDHPVRIYCGQRETTTVCPSEYPLANFFGIADI